MPRPRSQALFLTAIIVVLTVVAYIPAMRGEFIWDDDLYVTNNATLRSPQGLWAIWFVFRSIPQYYPLVHTTFWVEHHLWGVHPLGYHVVNVALHSLSAVLCWRLLARLQVPGAWLAAAIFALHPMHVESVAWITERKNVLSGVLYFTAFLLYWRFAHGKPLLGDVAPTHAVSVPDSTSNDNALPASTPQRYWWYYALALIAFLGALLSKTTASSLPAAILLVTWWKRGRLRWADIWPTLPFFIVALPLSTLTAYIEKHHVGANGPEWDFNLIERCLIAGRVVWFYAWKLIYPVGFCFVYPRWQIDSTNSWQYAFPSATVAVVVALFALRYRIGRGPLVAVLFYIGTLVPALGFVNVFPMRFSFVADHFAYLASLGLIVLIASLVTRIIERCNAAPAALVGESARPMLGVAMIGVILLSLSAITWKQGYRYRDIETLWRDTIATNEDAWLAHYNLAALQSRRGNHNDALPHFQIVLKLRPDSAEAHNGIALCLIAQGKLPEAVMHCQRAIVSNPGFAEAYMNLGTALGMRGDDAGALASFRRAVELDPRRSDFQLNLGVAYAKTGQFPQAAAAFTESLRLNPDQPAARAMLQQVTIAAQQQRPPR